MMLHATLMNVRYDVTSSLVLSRSCHNREIYNLEIYTFFCSPEKCLIFSSLLVRLSKIVPRLLCYGKDAPLQ